MSSQQKKILFIILAMLLFQLYIVINYSQICYLTDNIRSYFIDFHTRITPDAESFKIIKPDIYKKYRNVYSSLPETYIHSDHFLFYRAQQDISTKELADNSVIYTRYFKKNHLEQAIREYNGIKGYKIKAGSIVYIPHSITPLLPDLKKANRAPLIFTRGLYYTGSTAASEKMLSLIDKYIEQGINTIVFDAKDITGIVNYRSRIPAVIEYDTHEKRCIDDIEKLIRIFKEKNLYTIARIAVFRDHLLFHKKPELAIRSRNSGSGWNAHSSELWCDPTSERVQDYNIALAIELSELGVDEIQFDYIRFPTNGDLSDARYAYDFGRMTKEAAIAHFLARAYEEITKRNARLSIDIFGVVAWGKEVDIQKTGQRIELLSRSCDIISPMLYPSHFSDNFDGYENPGDNPYHFIYEGCKKVRALAHGKAIRPWLQAFKWRTSVYDKNYIIQQIKAAQDAGSSGYLFWNASNNYEIVLSALAHLAANKNKKLNQSREINRDR